MRVMFEMKRNNSLVACLDCFLVIVSHPNNVQSPLRNVGF